MYLFCDNLIIFFPPSPQKKLTTRNCKLNEEKNQNKVHYLNNLGHSSH